MVLAGKVITELGIRSSADKFFHIYEKQLHNIQNISEKVHETKLHQGDWHDVGSLKTWTFTVDGKVESCKEFLEEIDEKNKRVTFTISDGEIGKNYKMLKLQLHVIDKVDGAIVKWTIEYEKLNEDIEPPYRYLGFLTGVIKEIDAHVQKP